MSSKNKYVKLSRISEAKFRQILKFFHLDLSASQIKSLNGLNRNIVNRYLNEVLSRIALYCEAQSPFQGEIEVDESFFGAKRDKGKLYRGALGVTIVFGKAHIKGIESF